MVMGWWEELRREEVAAGKNVLYSQIRWRDSPFPLPDYVECVMLMEVSIRIVATMQNLSYDEVGLRAHVYSSLAHCKSQAERYYRFTPKTFEEEEDFDSEFFFDRASELEDEDGDD